MSISCCRQAARRAKRRTRWSSATHMSCTACCFNISLHAKWASRLRWGSAAAAAAGSGMWHLHGRGSSKTMRCQRWKNKNKKNKNCYFFLPFIAPLLLRLYCSTGLCDISQAAAGVRVHSQTTRLREAAKKVRNAGGPPRGGGGVCLPGRQGGGLKKPALRFSAWKLSQGGMNLGLFFN